MAASDSENGKIPNSEPSTGRANSGPNPVDLRESLVAFLRYEGVIRSPLLAKAFSTVPREIFLPSNVSLERVYSDNAIVVKWDENNLPSSSSSQPTLMADMLEALQLEPGLKVLEIGAGVGYNAALMADAVGNGTLVTTIDLDPGMAEVARQNLQNLAQYSAKNFDEVTVVTGDGSLGYPANAPYDRIIGTVQQWEIAPAWVEQLKVGGIILLPLTVSSHLWGGLIPALQKQPDGTLVGVGGSFGGFMPMRGEMAHPATSEGRMAVLPLNPSLLWTNQPGQGENVSKALISHSETLPGLEKFLEQPEFLVTGPEGNSPIDFSAGNTRSGRDTSHAFFGFNFLLAVASNNHLFTMYAATPQPPPEEGQPAQPNISTPNGWIRDGWLYETRGLALVEPTPDGSGYDLALVLPSHQPNQPDKLMEGWRLRQANAAPPALETPNLALEKVRQVWQSWQEMGQPLPSQFRPVAYPAGQPQPVPGYVLPRRFYSLVLPFSS